jgi:hypothetical protein
VTKTEGIPSHPAHIALLVTTPVWHTADEPVRVSVSYCLLPMELPTNVIVPTQEEGILRCKVWLGDCYLDDVENPVRDGDATLYGITMLG